MEPKRDAQSRPVTWEGGVVRYDKKGRATYIIRRWIGGRGTGRRYTVSTRCHTEGPATIHLRRFEADPQAYIESLRYIGSSPGSTRSV